MATGARPAKPAKPSRAEKKATRAAKRQQRRENLRTMRQAFAMTRERDRRFVPLFAGIVVATLAVVFVVVWLVSGRVYYAAPVAVILAALAGLFYFSRRAQTTAYLQAEGQAGAAGYMLKQQLRGDWRFTEAVAGTSQLDAVHRLVGRPGVVLVGEGAPHRVRGLLAQEKKRTARVVGETPIYDIVVGTEDGDVRLAKLNRYLLRLPANLSKAQVSSLEKRLAALGGARSPLPKGPMPQGAKMRNVQRTVRRRT